MPLKSLNISPRIKNSIPKANDDQKKRTVSPQQKTEREETLQSSSSHENELQDAIEDLRKPYIEPLSVSDAPQSELDEPFTTNTFEKLFDTLPEP